MTIFKWRTLVLTQLVLLLAVVTAYGQTVSGTWKASHGKRNKEKIQISFVSDDTGGDHKMGTGFKVDRLRGLSIDQINGPKNAVRFSIDSDAGTIDLEGTFENGKGSGTFVFNADPTFVSETRNLGFEDVSTKQLFASAVLDVKLSTVGDLRNSGLEIRDYDDVFKATIFKVDSTYIAEMSQAGFEKLDMQDLVKGKIFKIDADYAREVNALGFGDQTLEGLVKFRIFKITPEFLREVQQMGFAEISSENLVQMRIFKIDADFVNEMKSKGYANPTIEELVQLKIRGKID